MASGAETFIPTINVELTEEKGGNLRVVANHLTKVRGLFVVSA
jgi:hypothetical protein